MDLAHCKPPPINGIIQYECFYDHFFLFSIMSSRPIHVVTCISTSLLFIANIIIFKYITFYPSIYQLMNMGCFHFGEIMNNAVMNTHLQVLV